MALIWRNYNFRIYPSEIQKAKLEEQFGCGRFVYNHFLEIGKKKYSIEGRYPTLQNALDQLPKFISHNEFLKKADQSSLSYSVKKTDAAFRNHMLKRDSCIPRFKSKNDGRQSYTTKYIKGTKLISQGRINLPVIGSVKIKDHRKIANFWRPYEVTVIRKPSHQYEVSITLYSPDNLFDIDKIKAPSESKSDVIKDKNMSQRHLLTSYEKKSIGLDFSMKELIVDSNGKTASYPRYYRQSQETLSKEQRKLSLCKKGSKNYKKQRIKVARLMQKCSNQRQDFLHKLSSKLAKKYEVVCIETLSIQKMVKNNKLGKSAYDDSWFSFVEKLNYKLQERNRCLQKISTWFPSTKKCSQCGRVRKNFELNERIYRCVCGLEMSRDHNAAINIKTEGLRLFSKG